MAQSVKNLHAMWETWVPSLAWEDPSEEAWQLTPVLMRGEVSWREEPGGLKYELCNFRDSAYGTRALTFALKLVFCNIKMSSEIHDNNLKF